MQLGQPERRRAATWGASALCATHWSPVPRRPAISLLVIQDRKEPSGILKSSLVPDCQEAPSASGKAPPTRRAAGSSHAEHVRVPVWKSGPFADERLRDAGRAAVAVRRSLNQTFLADCAAPVALWFSLPGCIPTSRLMHLAGRGVLSPLLRQKRIGTATYMFARHAAVWRRRRPSPLPAPRPPHRL